LINYFKNNNKKVFKNSVENIINDIGLFNVNLSNINRAFNLFIIELLKLLRNKLEYDAILKLITAYNIFLIEFADYYHEKIKNILSEQKEVLELFNEKIIQSMSSGLLVLDNSLNILKYNKAFMDIAEIKAPEGFLINKNLKDILKSRKGIPIDTLMVNCLKTGRLNETEIEVIRKNGRKYHRKLRAEIFYNKLGEREGFIVQVIDTEYEKFLKDQFSRYLSFQVAEKILNEHEIKLEGEKRNVAVMFVDIRGFTKFSEFNPPELVLSTLNKYFELIIDIIFQFKGTLDKFIGDAIMVVFGAPFQDENDILNCIRCAREIQKKINKFNTIKSTPNVLEVGIGINYGEVISGNIGSEKRKDYTVIGDTVNIAERVQSITPAGKIYITENIVKNIRGEFNVIFLEEKKLKGKIKSVKIYELEQ
jgi:PAS domain S-box-containing protein